MFRLFLDLLTNKVTSRNTDMTTCRIPPWAQWEHVKCNWKVWWKVFSLFKFTAVGDTVLLTPLERTSNTHPAVLVTFWSRSWSPLLCLQLCCPGCFDVLNWFRTLTLTDILTLGKSQKPYSARSGDRLGEATLQCFLPQPACLLGGTQQRRSLNFWSHVMKATTKEGFRDCFRKCQERGCKCVLSKEGHFEGRLIATSFTATIFNFKRHVFWLPCLHAT